MVNPDDIRIKVDLKKPFPRSIISRQLSDFGYCLVKPSSTGENALLEVAKHFGRIQRHERSRRNGVVDVTSDDRLQTQISEKFKGLGTARFGPHTDGAFLNAIYSDERGYKRHISPPSYLILQCVQQAREGGESTLIDGQEVYRKVKALAPSIYQLLCEGIFHFVRSADKRLFPIEAPVFKVLANGNLSIRYREEFIVSTAYDGQRLRVADALRQFREQCIMHPDCGRPLMLTPGDVLIIDNFRMLHGRAGFKVVDGHHRHLRRVWVMDEHHLIRLNGDEPWDITSEQGGLAEFRARVLPYDDGIVTSYGALSGSDNHSNFIHAELGIKS
ncbi:TauD/TfdA family dioxygenase [Stakelama tenebrarum]|uniref:TauD/TfdA family dioxygenase n=1 Tax=Stakelama tenebrarum TaxID=2711215 RepID=A0A6G6Y3I6_9SPHN|nr:TauD/TfdA family dioxygenase [Sphingosinithalassobacter tenebrarum]QIG79459.1 TauD/TfdA family dioxygenase [Sphingosinithalassobacter tenebrarum]